MPDTTAPTTPPLAAAEADAPTRTIPEILRAHVVRLAAARRDLAEATDALAAAQTRFNAQHASLIQRRDQALARVLELELDVQAGALKHYRATGARRPCAGVYVETDCAIDAGRAWAWIREHRLERVLTRLDTRGIAKLASTLHLPFVDAAGALRPRIAADLDQALAAAEGA
jgi:hypothetical protein